MSRTIANNAPRDENWIVREIQAIKTAIREMRSARILNAAEIDAGGLQITHGGSLKVINPDTGIATFFVGNEPLSDGSGRTQMSLITWRDDGTPALQIRDGGIDLNHAHQQAVQWYARLGRTVLADDTKDGTSLARPHIEAGGLYNTDISTWPATNASTFTTIANRYMEIQNPRITWQIQLFAESGVTGQFRMLVNGTQVGTVQSVAALTFATWSTTVDRPANVNAGDVVMVELQALSSASSGKAKGQCLRIGGEQSS